MECFYPFPGSQITILVITATVKPGQEAVPGNLSLLRTTSVSGSGYPADLQDDASTSGRCWVFTRQFWPSPKHPTGGGPECPGSKEQHLSCPQGLEIQKSTFPSASPVPCHRRKPLQKSSPSGNLSISKLQSVTNDS